jgi:hypothetical protein
MNIEVWHAAKAEVEKLMTGTLPINGPVSTCSSLAPAARLRR